MHDELEAQGDKLRKFESEVSALRQLQREIDAYLGSSKEDDLARINEKIASLQRRLQSKNDELAKIKPELSNIAKAIGDQEAHKKLIEDNLKLIGYKEDIAKLEEDIAQMDADVKKVKGYDTFAKALEDCQKQLGELSQRRSHHEGRRGAFLEQIRTLKVSGRRAKPCRVNAHSSFSLNPLSCVKYHVA
jgi:chromosome segregation ATPase